MPVAPQYVSPRFPSSSPPAKRHQQPQTMMDDDIFNINFNEIFGSAELLAPAHNTRYRGINLPKKKKNGEQMQPRYSRHDAANV